MGYLLNTMNNAQIVRMLNTTIYRHLPTTHKNVTFKTLIRKLINFINGRRMRRYVVLRINQALDLHDNYEDVEEEVDDAARLEEAEEDPEDTVHEKMCRIYDEFSDEGQRWIDRFCNIVDKATEDQQFVMLNLLRILNLGPEPDEGLQQAKDRNADAINNRQV
jgi:thiaminase